VTRVHQVLHGLAIKKHAGASDIARLVGLSEEATAAILRAAAVSGRALERDGKYLLSPLAQVAVESDYSRRYAALRENRQFLLAYDTFEKINVELKSLITSWQTMDTGGRRIPNDHSDGDYDMRIIDRLGELHERADMLLAQFERVLPRFSHYRTQLLSAVENAENGKSEWVSSPKLESYHTLWFELHEDLLRMLGRRRRES
jgi:hypothetical protein